VVKIGRYFSRKPSASVHGWNAFPASRNRVAHDDGFGGDVAAGTRPILDQEGLTEMFRQPSTD
jgi:hypothetical protein